MRKLIITLIALTLLLSACTGSNTETFNDISAELGDSGGADGDFTAADAPEDALSPLAYEGDVLANRKIIQEAFLELTDDDTEGLYKRITSLVERAGGFVASAELTR